MGGWRNALVFDPLAKYGDFSYYDIMLKPLASALNAVVGPETKVRPSLCCYNSDTTIESLSTCSCSLLQLMCTSMALQVWFAMQGEMSATVFFHPRPYTSLVETLKQDITAGRPDADLVRKHIRIGVSTNFNKLCACVLMDLIDPTEYLAKLPAAMKPLMKKFNTSAIQELYQTVDLIGISSYASIAANFKAENLEDAISQFDQEISVFGVNLKDLIHKQQKVSSGELHTCG